MVSDRKASLMINESTVLRKRSTLKGMIGMMLSPSQNKKPPDR